MYVLKNQKAFTLLEVLIGMTILVMVLLPVLKMFGDTMVGVQKYGDISKASQLVQCLLEEIKSKKWDENTPDDGGACAPGNRTFPLGSEGGPHNDIDDYDGYSDTVDKFTRSVQVRYATVPNAGAVTYPAGVDDFKEITVTVTWSNSNPVIVKSIRANYPKY